MSTKRRFTDQMLEKIAAPNGGRLEIADELCPGLVLRVTPAGVKTFGALYRVPGESVLGAASERRRTGLSNNICAAARNHRNAAWSD